MLREKTVIMEEINEQLEGLKGATDATSQDLRHSLLREKQAIIMGRNPAQAEILGGFKSNESSDNPDENNFD